jgi:hypothetical protein
MFSPTGLYVCGALFVSILVASRFISRRKTAALFLAALAVTAVESGLLTDFGLPLPAGLLLVLSGLRLQVAASGAILAVNLLLVWVAFRLLFAHGGHAHDL